MRFLVIYTLLLAIPFAGKANADMDYFIGSSAFTLANLNTKSKEPPHFYQLNLGMRLNEKHAISLEWMTWRYYAPLGIPYGNEKGKQENNFPGHVRAHGFGLAYQYFFNNGWYTALHAQWMDQSYRNKDNEKLGSGNQLFITSRVGYQFRFLNDLLFLEPNLAITYWPTNTNLPDNFQEQEDRWNDYFLFEPGLHFGIYF